jgi:hypothetical protein
MTRAPLGRNTNIRIAQEMHFSSADKRVRRLGQYRAICPLHVAVAFSDSGHSLSRGMVVALVCYLTSYLGDLDHVMPVLLFGGWHIFRAHASGEKHHAGRKKIERDTRFVVQSALLYRPTGALSWYKGAIQNVSPSGVLFQAEKLVPRDCPIEISFSLPAEAGSKRRIQVFCWGKVARAVTPAAGDVPPSLAAKIVRYRSEAHIDPEIQFQTAA